MASNVNIITRKDTRDLLERLAPIGEISGVSDYLLVDTRGIILARKPDSIWEEQVAAACARDVAQIGEILALLPVGDGDERVFDLRFKGTLLIGWDLGSAYLFAFCKQDVNLAIMRMTVNVIKHELKKNKRFRKYLADRADGGSALLSEQAVGTELYKRVVAVKQK